MQLMLTAIVFSTFLWWFSTGIIFYLNARPVHTFRWSMLAATLVLAAALYGLWTSAASTTVSSAFVSFSCGLLIWGWHTMSYYMGIVTGPRKAPCPASCSGWMRFVYAASTGLYHELAIIVTVILMAWLTWDQPNQVGLWSFILLWLMHVSAKLNVFLGVRNLNIEFIPKRLQYLTTYFRQAPMNLLFPFSVTAGTIITVLLTQQAMNAEAASFSEVGFILLASLLALAVIEHWFMILPIPAETLWRWSLNSSKSSAVSRPSSDTLSSSRRRDADPAITSLPEHQG